jgi:hypothetical protein
MEAKKKKKKIDIINPTTTKCGSHSSLHAIRATASGSGDSPQPL